MFTSAGSAGEFLNCFSAPYYFKFFVPNSNFWLGSFDKVSIYHT